MKTSIGAYLISKLEKEGVEHVFGVPGDYFLNFFHMVESSSLKTINTCDEQGAGFAADAYARLRGLSACAVTWGAGGLKLLNATAQAYAERSPVIVLTGAPSTEEQKSDKMVHHKVEGFNHQYEMFKHVTTAATRLTADNPFKEIDHVFNEVKKWSRPGYIEIPVDLVEQEFDAPDPLPAVPQGQEDEMDPQILEEVMGEVSKILEKAKQPIIMVGLDVHRFHLQNQVKQLIESNGFPFVTNHLSKSVLPETHPNFVGLYEGGASQPDIRKFVEDSDCLIMLGVYLNDFDTGNFTAKFNWEKTVHAQATSMTIGKHTFSNFGLKSFINAFKLVKKGKTIMSRSTWPTNALTCKHTPEPTKKITTCGMFACLNTSLRNAIVIPDTGIALLGSGSELLLPEDCFYIGSTYYTSMGFAVPGAIGIQLAKPDKRPIVLVGDGCFQMTGLELSQAVRNKLSPIVIILNNKGYSTERLRATDGEFNNILNWNLTKVPELLGGGKACRVQTEGEFCQALKNAYSDPSTFHIIEATLDPMDFSAPMKRLEDIKKSKAY